MARTSPTTTGTDRQGGRATDGPPSDIADPGLALAGQPGIAWAERAMPVLGMVRASFADRLPFAGLTVACCLHVTAETAVLVRALTAGGARVHLAASNPLSTQDDIAAALAAEPGVTVQARSGVDRGGYYEHLHRVLDIGPDLVMDDGCDLVNTLHEARSELIGGVRGGCEATSTGAARLRRMAAAGSLGFPVVAADVSTTRRLIDHKYGTGQSVLDGILRATNTLVAGKTVVVAGFGPCGSGIAERARGLGGQVIVTEVDPVRALGAIMQGFRVMPMRTAAPAAELIITATGSRDVVGAAELAALPDGVVLANAGHFDVEIDVTGLAGLAVEVNPGVRPNATEYVLADGRRLILLAEGRVVNLVAGEGNPAAAMDTSFAVQALALAWLAEADPRPADARGRVLDVPAAIDAEVASLALAALGTNIDELTAEQLAYLDSWRLGS
ncbi:MAG TPA: adenosylhomocysteinase [Streptosporangiaceae bacterium]|nr:adenosylhomocysteinase [Streptosporangiaceae bacterium]